MSDVVEIADARFGYKLLELLGLAGWTVEVRPRIGGGVIVHALRPGLAIELDGDSVAAIAPQVFEAAVEALHKLRAHERVTLVS